MTQNHALFTVVETPIFTVICLLLIYAKGVRDEIDTLTLNKIRSTLDGKDD